MCDLSDQDDGALDDGLDSGAEDSTDDLDFGDLETDFDCEGMDLELSPGDVAVEMSSLPEVPAESGETCELAEDPDFQAWCQDLTADLDQATLEALWKGPDCRSPREVELVDAALHPEYESQMIFRTDAETGQALRDEVGEWVTDTRRSAGTQVPDGFYEDELGLHFREEKCYSNASNLMRNISDQTAARRAGFGDDVDITYVLAPKFTVEEAERIQQYCEETLGVNLEWQD